MKITDKIELYNCDNMELMAKYPDNYFDLAIVDPPYGLMDKLVNGGAGRNGKFDKNKDSVKWDVLPTKEYFIELMRVSENQIIWGSNYFDLPPTRCNIIWDKMQEFTGSDFELAWTSFDKASKAFRMSRVEAYSQGKIHPTQKPVALMEYLIRTYSDEGSLVLDNCSGSGTTGVACENTSRKYILIEKDEHYFNIGHQRLLEHVKGETIE